MPKILIHVYKLLSSNYIPKKEIQMLVETGNKYEWLIFAMKNLSPLMT